MRFRYRGVDLDGFDDPYNTTILNERAVEIAVCNHLAPDLTGDGLEVGNVLGHYGWTGHRVVDLYEQAPGVENIDVLDIEGAYDWIIAISTLEHVRWDTEPRDPHGAVQAIRHLRSLLRRGGRMLVTVPGGHHPVLDTYLTYCDADAVTMVRSGPTWVQTAEPEFLPYGFSTNWAESVWIGEFRG